MFSKKVERQMVEIIKGEVWDRCDFGTLCEWRMLYRVIEVGVDRGEFANTFLSRSQNCNLYLGVDPYTPYPEMQWDRAADFHAACTRFERYASKAKLMRTTSADAAQYLASSESLLYSRPYEFIYIDGGHRKEEVFADLVTWWPMLSNRGIIAGHDWSGDHPGVREAVIEFAHARQLTIHVTWKDEPSSYYLFKDGSRHPWSNRSGEIGNDAL